jgi:formylglycine-generating enzyme required for sulfatase activity
MAKIFISYRRQDSAGVAGRIYDRLRAHFGDEAVFMDIDTIPFGEDFREQIGAAVSQCEVVLAVIGSRWSWNTKTRRRIDDPRDFVRIELEAALERNLPVIPILVDHARMPGEGDLPASLSRLAFRNALELDQGRDFHSHVDRLIRGIEFHFLKSAGGTAKPAPALVSTSVEQEASPVSPAKRLTNSVGMTLVRIEPGEFLMGTSEDQVDRLLRLRRITEGTMSWDAEQPEHLVTITRPFLVGLHEVTEGEYRGVIGANTSEFQGSDDMPVLQVSWRDAVHFCNELGEREGRHPYYRVEGNTVTSIGGNGYRLPTEAEWEYACRAGTSTLYPIGNDAGALGEYAWHRSNSDDKPHPVGQKRANAWGLHDMLGNVWEWCADGYDEKYYARSPVSDPPGPFRAWTRVLRGGSWNCDRRICRPAYRYEGRPEAQISDIGFRVAAFRE